MRNERAQQVYRLAAAAAKLESQFQATAPLNARQVHTIAEQIETHFGAQPF